MVTEDVQRSDAIRNLVANYLLKNGAISEVTAYQDLNLAWDEVGRAVDDLSCDGWDIKPIGLFEIHTFKWETFRAYREMGLIGEVRSVA